MASVYQNINKEIEQVAEQLHRSMEIGPIDALHIASAELARVDFFITCDYNLIKRYKGTMTIVSPKMFLERYESS